MIKYCIMHHYPHTNTLVTVSELFPQWKAIRRSEVELSFTKPVRANNYKRESFLNMHSNQFGQPLTQVQNTLLSHIRQ